MATATLEVTDNATETGDELVVTTEQFDLAKHDAVVTLVSPKTGDHRTFRVSSIHDGPLAGKKVLSLLEGPDNTNDYRGFAFVSQGEPESKYPAGIVFVWKRFKGQGEKSLWERYADMLSRPKHWEQRGVQYLISLRCRRCGHSLTRPDSIADGLGPVCRSKV